MLIRDPKSYTALPHDVTATPKRTSSVDVERFVSNQQSFSKIIPPRLIKDKRLFARFEIFTDISVCRDPWIALEHRQPLSTPYQGYAWLSAWQSTIGVASGITPLIVIGYDLYDKPIMLLPLGTQKLTVGIFAHFLGGKHSNFNAPIWDMNAFTQATPRDMKDLFEYIHVANPRIDLIVLLNQPRSWQGYSNLLASYPHQSSPSFAWLGRISPRTLPKRLKKKEKKIASFGEIRYWQPRTPDEISTILEIFFRQKEDRLRKSGLPNAFDSYPVQNFLRQSTTLSPDGTAPVELFAMSVGTNIAAIYGGSSVGSRFCFSFNSINDEPESHYSPGLILLHYVIQTLSARGITTIDLGVGEDPYKRSVCPFPEPLFDLFLPLTSRGRLYCLLVRFFFNTKRKIKQTPFLFAIYMHCLRTFTRIRRFSGGQR